MKELGLRSPDMSEELALMFVFQLRAMTRRTVNVENIDNEALIGEKLRDDFSFVNVWSTLKYIKHDEIHECPICAHMCAKTAMNEGSGISRSPRQRTEYCIG